jgi:hypothetical protein
MFKNITNISSVSSKINKFARAARSKTVLTAAAMATTVGLASKSFAVDITAVTTTTTTGSTGSASGVIGWVPTSAGETFTSSTAYNVTYAGQDQKLTSVSVGSSLYNVSPTIGTTTFQTQTGAGLQPLTSLWETGGGTGGASTPVPLNGPLVTSDAAAFSGNNFAVGSDNVFSSQPPVGNTSADEGDVVRIDVLFTGGLKANASSGFAVFDRGNSGGHDPFGIAAITAETGGVPTAYAGLVTTYDTAGSWGNTNLLGAAETDDILRSNVSAGSLHPANQVSQNIGGTLIPTDTLVAAGTTIYGYSLFSKSVTSATNLVTVSGLPTADDTTNGGLDPVATTGLLYTAAVPEPTSAALLVVGAAGFLARRPKRKTA